MGVVLAEEQIARILEHAESALREYVGADGRVAFDIPAHIVTATKPWVSESREPLIRAAR
jgi:hypothetical protein